MKPHKHAALIKAWADGAQIQWKYDWNKDSTWRDVLTEPVWNDASYEYRIKPEREYPKSSLCGGEAYSIYTKNFNGGYSYLDALHEVANAAIKRYIQDQEGEMTDKAWHATGMGEVHSADHKYMIDCLAEIDDPNQDYVACNELAEKVSAALNAVSSQPLTNPQIRTIAICDGGMYQDDETANWECSDEALMKFSRALLLAAQGHVP